jgi:hypothetical protein
VVVNERGLAGGSRFDSRLDRLAELGPPAYLAEDGPPNFGIGRRGAPGRQDRLLGECSGAEAKHRDHTKGHTLPLHVRFLLETPSRIGADRSPPSCSCQAASESQRNQRRAGASGPKQTCPAASRGQVFVLNFGNIPAVAARVLTFT